MYVKSVLRAWNPDGSQDWDWNKWVTFDTLVHPYIKAGNQNWGKQGALWQSPSDPFNGVAAFSWLPDGKRHRSYAMPSTENFGDPAVDRLDPNPAIQGASRSGTSLPVPADTLMLVTWPNKEGVSGLPINSQCYAAIMQQMFNRSDYWSNEALDDALKNKPLYNDGWNYTFADGHAKYFKPEATVGDSGRAISTSTGRPRWKNTIYNNATRGMWTIAEND